MAASPVRSPAREVDLHPNHVVRFLQPVAQLIVQIDVRRDPDVVTAPARAVIDSLGNSMMLQPAMEGEAGQEVLFARVEAGKSDARDSDETGFLGEDLDVAE